MLGTKRSLRCIRSARRRSIIAVFVYYFFLLDLVHEAGLLVMGYLRRERREVAVLKQAIREPISKPRGEAHWLE